MKQIDFDSYNFTELEIKEKISNVLKCERKKWNKQKILKFILSTIDLTSLNGSDKDDDITNLCNKALLYSVSAVCVYPNLVHYAKKALAQSSVKIASVAGCFPSGQSDLSVKLKEVEYALNEGADEIDMVISRGKFLEGKYEEVSDEIKAIKKCCKNKTLKVILETGELQSIANIRKASEIAILSGADFIKTSTGKINQSATLEAVWVMIETIMEYYKKSRKMIGIKPSGGISEVDDAINYYILMRYLLEPTWFTCSTIRFGASRLADNIYNELEKVR